MTAIFILFNLNATMFVQSNNFGAKAVCNFNYVGSLSTPNRAQNDTIRSIYRQFKFEMAEAGPIKLVVANLWPI